MGALVMAPQQGRPTLPTHCEPPPVLPHPGHRDGGMLVGRQHGGQGQPGAELYHQRLPHQVHPHSLHNFSAVVSVDGQPVGLQLLTLQDRTSLTS
ncbi:Rho-related GTP-binding protein RhoU [Fukomys damarensis]|uniref:Rho-related GTP-binding protein RhoU n=1 Tax=Fukomys damarensis TaxID=885580 RepID=A0A091DPA7_FUKDA|nr:Rho-related GTP-binding protein RhoU [Fukomys damarensis]